MYTCTREHHPSILHAVILSVGRDVEACKANLAAHDAVKDDITLNRPRFEDMDKLAEKLTRGGSPEAAKIKRDNQELQAILNKLDEDWEVS